MSWLLDSSTIARSVKTAGLPSVDQIKECEANWECPQCGCRIVDNNVSNEWPGLPIGVKFDPSDVELLEHLANKREVQQNIKQHPFIDKYITTLDGEERICNQHPENLPGSRKDGNSVHFFYRATNAYTTGQRKRRKIDNGTSLTTRWHNTGKTKVIFKNGVHLGFKKIMVLYGSAVGGSKPSKMNWVMHQYNLGTDKDEKEGEYVVSKVFYQAQKQVNNTSSDVDEVEEWMRLNSPPYEEDPFYTHELRDDVKDTTCANDSQAKTCVTSDTVGREASLENLDSKCFPQIYLPPIFTHELKEDDVKETTCEDDSHAFESGHSLYNNDESGHQVITMNLDIVYIITMNLDIKLLR
ncbi:hypothetical protein Lser_V15G13242 [Lactuca serriola]